MRRAFAEVRQAGDGWYAVARVGRGSGMSSGPWPDRETAQDKADAWNEAARPQR